MANNSGRELLLAHLGLVRDLVAFIGRKHHLADEQVEDVESFVRLRLLADDHAVLRQFRGQSSLRTYLSVVVQRLFLDWANHEWGKWRISAAARRLGPIAAELEELLHRDGLSFAEAAQVLAGRRPSIAHDDLLALYAALPARSGRGRGKPLEDGPVLAAEPSPEADALHRDSEAAVTRALGRLIRGLRARDRLLLRLRFAEGLAVTEIARGLATPPKTLYRHFDRLLRELRRALREAGVDADDIAVLLEQTTSLDLGLGAGKLGPGTWPQTDAGPTGVSPAKGRDRRPGRPPRR